MLSNQGQGLGQQAQMPSVTTDLRDYFASQAMAGLIAEMTHSHHTWRSWFFRVFGWPRGGALSIQMHDTAALAEAAYRYADAMLIHRARLMERDAAIRAQLAKTHPQLFAHLQAQQN